MKEIKKGIVFSNDIKQILNGDNAFDYSYGNVPDKGFIEALRSDFRKGVNKIFNDEVTIVTEEEMGMISKLNGGEYPHRYFRQNIC